MIARTPMKPPSQKQVPPLRAGSNLRQGSNLLGTWFSARSGGSDFSHPFTVTVAGGAAYVSRGFVYAGDDGVEPRIGSVPIGGDERHGAPTLRLDAGIVNDRKESWVCVEVTPDEDGKLGEKAKVEVVQREHPSVPIGDTGRTPLALLLYESGDVPQVWQIAYFHFHYITTPAAEKKQRGHFFL